MDYEINKKAKLLNIKEIAKKLGIPEKIYFYMEIIWLNSK